MDNQKQTTIPELLQNYIKQNTAIHRERFERLEQCNSIMAKEYRLHNNDLDAMQSNKNEFNRELDATINMLRAIDDIEGGLTQVEMNGVRIMELLTKVEKKVVQKIQASKKS